MKRELLYERSQTASRMEARMVIVAGISVVAAIFALLRADLLACFGFLILGALAFALSRVFDLLGDLFASMQSSDERTSVASAREQLSEP